MATVGLVIAGKLERLEEDAAHVSVDALEPGTELWVAAGTVDEDVDGVEDTVHRGVVAEALKEGAELESGEVELVALGDGVGVDAGKVLGGGASMLNALAEVETEAAWAEVGSKRAVIGLCRRRCGGRVGGGGGADDAVCELRPSNVEMKGGGGEDVCNAAVKLRSTAGEQVSQSFNVRGRWRWEAAG